jgi:uncharacterized protein
MKHLLVILLAFACFALHPATAGENIVGKTVSTVKIIDPDNKPADIPFLGQKVVMVVYTDPDVKDVNDPLSVAVKAKNYPTTDYAGVGIANCKDTWIPDAAIRMKARQKQQQFPGSVILLDEGRKISQDWELGDCNGKGVVILIGKDKKVKYFKKVSTPEESKAITAEVIRIIDAELGK